jgi:hypothetical protein
VLWHTFEDNYAFFRVRRIDWAASYRRYRPRITAGTSDDSLFAVCSRMLAPFQDNHINLIVPGVKQFKSVKPSRFAREFPTDSLRGQFWGLVEATLTRQGFGPLQALGPAFHGQPLFRYAVSPTLGYLRFNRCFVDPDADNKADAAVLGKLLAELLPRFDKTKALIIDVRDNIGGNDEFGFELAGHFTSRPVRAMTKQTRRRGGATKSWKRPKPGPSSPGARPPTPARCCC